MSQGRDELEMLIKNAAPEAFKRVMYLSETAENEAVRLAANREIIDRHLGKPTQKVEASSVSAHVNLDMTKIEQELKALEAQEKALLGTRERISASNLKDDSGGLASSDPSSNGTSNPDPESLSA